MPERAGQWRVLAAGAGRDPGRRARQARGGRTQELRAARPVPWPHGWELGVERVFHTSREVKWHKSSRISFVPANCTWADSKKQECLGGLVTDESHRSVFFFLQDSVKADAWTLRYRQRPPGCVQRGMGLMLPSETCSSGQEHTIEALKGTPHGYCNHKAPPCLPRAPPGHRVVLCLGSHLTSTFPTGT